MNAIVVDANVALKWLIPEDGSLAAKALDKANLKFLAPDFVLVECANAVWKKIQRQQLSQHQAIEIIRTLNNLPIKLLNSNDLLESACELAIQLNHPVYDCLYLALAIAFDTYLITADKRFYNTIRKTSLDEHVQYLNGCQ